MKKDIVIGISAKDKIALQNQKILEEEEKMMVLRLPNTRGDSDSNDDYDDEALD